MRVLITGGLGYLGSLVVERLQKRGDFVVVFDNGTFGKEPIQPLLGQGNIELVEGNLADMECFPELCEGVQAVIHLGGLSNDPTCDVDPVTARKINVEATRVLARMAKDANVPRFIFASSCSVYGGYHDVTVTEDSEPQPISLYAETKVEGEEILQEMNSSTFCVTSIRLGTLFGWSPRMRFDLAVNLMTLHAFEKGEISVTGGGRQWRPFIHVQDVVTVLELILDSPTAKVCGQVFNVGSNENNIQIETLAHRVQSQFPNVKVEVVPEDADPRSYRVHFDKLGKVLGFKAAYSVEDGVKEILARLKKGTITDAHSDRYSNLARLMSQVNTAVVAGGLPVRSTFLPLVRPSIGQEEKAAVLEVMDSGWLTGGPKTIDFETAFADYVEAPNAVSVNSCTSALHLALAALEIGPGDEVITTPITFAATANVVVHRGAKLVFADVDPDTLNIAPKEIERKISDRTKAIIPVHMAGRPCLMEEIQNLANTQGIHVIEDAAHAVGSFYRGTPIGSVSEFTAFSFYPAKNITTAEGGMITLRDGELAEKLRVMRLHGMANDAWKRYSAEGHLHWEIVLPGYKNNMTDLQAVIGLVQLRKLNGFKRRRAEIVRMYNEAFADEKGLTVPAPASPEDSICWHLYIVQLNLESLSCTRDDFARALKLENIGLGFHFIALHLHPYYRDTYHFKAKDFPNANHVSERILSLPLFTDMSNKDVEDVIFSIKKLLRHFSQ